MKKLKLKALALGGGEVLSRAQLKNVLGGEAAPNPCDEPINNCTQCCSAGLSLCGQCNSVYATGCTGHGILLPCCTGPY